MVIGRALASARYFADEIMVMDAGYIVEAITGCPFAPRCPHAMNKCWAVMPAVFNLNGGERWTRCYLFEDGNGERILSPNRVEKT